MSDTPPPARYSWSLAAITLLWAGGTVIALLFVVPKFKEVYDQVQVPLTASFTVWTLRASAVVCRWPFAFTAGALALSAWAGAWKGSVSKNARVVVPLAVLASIAVIGWGLFDPLLSPLGRRGR